MMNALQRVGSTRRESNASPSTGSNNQSVESKEKIINRPIIPVVQSKSPTNHPPVKLTLAPVLEGQITSNEDDSPEKPHNLPKASSKLSINYEKKESKQPRGDHSVRSDKLLRNFPSEHEFLAYRGNFLKKATGSETSESPESIQRKEEKVVSPVYSSGYSDDDDRISTESLLYIRSKSNPQYDDSPDNQAIYSVNRGRHRVVDDQEFDSPTGYSEQSSANSSGGQYYQQGSQSNRYSNVQIIDLDISISSSGDNDQDYVYEDAEDDAFIYPLSRGDTPSPAPPPPTAHQRYSSSRTSSTIGHCFGRQSSRESLIDRGLAHPIMFAQNQAMLMAGIGDRQLYDKHNSRRRLPDTPFSQSSQEGSVNPYEKSIADQLRNIKKSAMLASNNKRYVDELKYRTESEVDSYETNQMESFDLEEWRNTPPPPPAPDQNIRYSKLIKKQTVEPLQSVQYHPQMNRYQLLRSTKKPSFEVRHQCSFEEEQLDSTDEFEEAVHHADTYTQSFSMRDPHYMKQYQSPPQSSRRPLTTRTYYMQQRAPVSQMPDLISSTDWLVDKCDDVPMLNKRNNYLKSKAQLNEETFFRRARMDTVSPPPEPAPRHGPPRQYIITKNLPGEHPHYPVEYTQQPRERIIMEAKSQQRAYSKQYSDMGSQTDLRGTDPPARKAIPNHLLSKSINPVSSPPIRPPYYEHLGGYGLHELKDSNVWSKREGHISPIRTNRTSMMKPFSESENSGNTQLPHLTGSSSQNFKNEQLEKTTYFLSAV